MVGDPMNLGDGVVDACEVALYTAVTPQEGDRNSPRTTRSRSAEREPSPGDPRQGHHGWTRGRSAPQNCRPVTRAWYVPLSGPRSASRWAVVRVDLPTEPQGRGCRWRSCWALRSRAASFTTTLVTRRACAQSRDEHCRHVLDDQPPHPAVARLSTRTASSIPSLGLTRSKLWRPVGSISGSGPRLAGLADGGVQRVNATELVLFLCGFVIGESALGAARRSEMSGVCMRTPPETAHRVARLQVLRCRVAHAADTAMRHALTGSARVGEPIVGETAKRQDFDTWSSQSCCMDVTWGAPG
jgi:hypothetical protein